MRLQSTALVICLALVSAAVLPTLGLPTRIENRHYETLPTDDLDPLVNLEAGVQVTRIRSMEATETTFQVTVTVNGTTLSSPQWTGMEVHPNWTAVIDVPDDDPQPAVDLTVSATAETTAALLAPCEGNTSTLSLLYNLKTGTWSGDDALADEDGYGHVAGAAGCEIWFEVVQNDYDGDGLSYWTETERYHTDPTVSNVGVDTDGDGPSDVWEHHWGYNPVVAEPHGSLDPDSDALSNGEEYRTWQWQSNPFYRDVYIEVDWAEGATPLTPPYRMPERSKQYLLSVFARHGIALHIDDGWMGGGEEIPYDEEPSFDRLYRTYFLGGFTGDERWRQGVFHYAVLWGPNPGKKSVGGFNFCQDGFVVCVGTIRTYRLREEARTTTTASLFMHELGHNLGLFRSDFEAIDNTSCNFPWRKGWYIYADYESCMNYRYAWHLIDYSSGGDVVDHDDWGTLDLYHFQHH